MRPLLSASQKRKMSGGLALAVGSNSGVVRTMRTSEWGVVVMGKWCGYFSGRRLGL